MLYVLLKLEGIFQIFQIWCQKRCGFICTLGASSYECVSVKPNCSFVKACEDEPLILGCIPSLVNLLSEEGQGPLHLIKESLITVGDPTSWLGWNIAALCSSPWSRLAAGHSYSLEILLRAVFSRTNLWDTEVRKVSLLWPSTF